MTPSVKFRARTQLGWTLLGLLVLGFVSVALHAARPVTIHSSLLAFLAVVLFGAWFGGFLAGFAATLVSLIVACYLFIPPIHSFRVASGRDLVALALAAGEGILISWLCGRHTRLKSAHLAAVEELEAVRAEVRQNRQDLADLGADLRQLQNVVPGWTAAALKVIREGREFLAAGVNRRRNAPAILDRMAQAERSIASMAAALLECAPRGCGQRCEPLESRDVLEGVIDALKPLTGAPRIVLPQSLPAVAVEEPDLLRVFHEILSNAVRFAAEDDPRIEVTCHIEGDRCRFAVSDNGEGMIPLRAAEAFILFSRPEPDDSEHLGVGLAVARRIVRGYGGDIWLRSSVGRGTTVFFTVPITSRASSLLSRAS